MNSLESFKKTFETAISSNFGENHPEYLRKNTINAFYQFYLHLSEVNAHTNLTAIRDECGIVCKHFVDSLFLCDYLFQGAKVLDMGCGAGFPSLPLAIVRPDLTVYALDSTGKKTQFVAETAKILGISNVKTVTGRAEESKTIQTIGKTDFVVSRAMAEYRILCELATGYLPIGGTLLAMKSRDVKEEIALAEPTCRRLLGSFPTVSSYLLKECDDEGKVTAESERFILSVTKEITTPKGYPRVYGQILKKPILL